MIANKVFILHNSQLTKASAKADSASLLCCNIFWAITGLDAGLGGGRSLAPLLLNRPRLESRVGLVSRDASLEPAVDRGMPDDRRRGRGESWSEVLLRLYMYRRELGEPDRLVATIR